MNFGQFINTISIDIQHILNFVKEYYTIFIIPTVFAYTFYNIYNKLGSISLLGILIIGFYTFLVKYITTIASRFLKINITISDKRNKHLKAGLLGIKSVKFNGLESIIEEEAIKNKYDEFESNFKVVFVRNFIYLISVLGPVLTSFICISIFFFQKDGTLSVGDIYFIIMNFKHLEKPMKYISGTYFLYA